MRSGDLAKEENRYEDGGSEAATAGNRHATKLTFAALGADIFQQLTGNVGDLPYGLFLNGSLAGRQLRLSRSRREP
jgi:hypothetical protein